MKAEHLRRWVLVLSFLCALTSTGLAVTTNTMTSVRVILDIKNGKPQYELNSKPVKSGDLINALEDIILKTGREKPILVFLHETSSLATLENTMGIIDKVGFLHVRYFMFTDDKRMMKEDSFEH